VNVKKARDVRGALVRKGFTETGGGRDHIFYFLYYNQKKTNVWTKISHNETDIRAPLLSGMAKQLKITNREFGDFIECSLDGDGYIRLLIERNTLTPDPIQG
jgi:hypothetical protein